MQKSASWADSSLTLRVGEFGVVKVRRPGGDLAYAVPEYEPDRIAPQDHLRRVLAEWVAALVEDPDHA